MLPQLDEEEVPPPPQDTAALLKWSEAHGVADRLDDLLFGGEAGVSLAGRFGEVLTYREILLEPPGKREDRILRQDSRETALRYLHRMAKLAVAHRHRRRWMEEHGRDPDDEVLRRFLDRLRSALVETMAEVAEEGDHKQRPPGTYQPAGVRLATTPVPMLRYRESGLTGPQAGQVLAEEELAVPLLGWDEGPLRWARFLGSRELPANEATADHRRRALEAMIDLLRDPRAEEEQQSLIEHLLQPAWQFALGTLDQQLERLHAQSAAGAGREERIGYRVEQIEDGVIHVNPIVQKRGRSGTYSSGARLQWHNLGLRRDLTAGDERVYQAYSDRLARAGQPWNGWFSGPQTYGVLQALIDHPAVYLEGDREGARLDIRQGRMKLRFASVADGGLSPRFELLGVSLAPEQVARTLRGGRHFMYLHRAEGAAPQVLLAELTLPAAALAGALALAPGRFPPEAHDALAGRLEPLQEALDIEFPSHWTRTITAAEVRPLARLELLASGALKIRLSVRPVKQGPVFAPGEGPALVLEGQGRERHGVRRDPARERQAAHTLVERLGLEAFDELEPWCWRVSAGDPALDVVATLKELADEVSVEWADDLRLSALGSISRADMRLKVADQRDWFAVDGGAEVEGEVVPLHVLLAAIRDGRRYVPVGSRGFVRIEETLRQALARAEGATFESRGTLHVARVASDSLLGLVEMEAQLAASKAFSDVRRRMAEGAEQVLRLPAEVEATIRPYQRAGVAWMARLAHWGAGAVLADEMGLGKTLQTLALLAHRASEGPALVVAPTSVVGNWIDEAARFAPELRMKLYRGVERQPLLRGLGAGDVVVTSYAIATLDAERLGDIAFGTLVLDEAQAVKNASTERAKALRGLRAGWRLGLTGTPIENHLGELWSLMRIVSPGLLGSWEQFRGRYAVPIEKFGDLTRRKTLATLLSPFILRRTKSEVARELPARTEVVKMVRLSAEEQTLYEELRQSTLEHISQTKKDRDKDASEARVVLLSALTRLRQLCCHPRLVYPRSTAGSAKAAYLLDLLSELREGDHRTLVFSQFRSFLDILAPRLAQHGFRVLVLDGTTPAPVREQRIAAFQRGEAEVFLISLKAGGFGLNLTAADTVIHLDPWWNPAVEDQATARAHRIGQQRPVTAVRLVARGTVEEAVLGLHAAKRALAAGVLEGSDVAARLSSEELVDLIRRGVSGPEPERDSDGDTDGPRGRARNSDG